MKKEDIVEASIKLIEQKGYEKTSVSQIVQEAGVAQGTFYLYFSTKHELVVEIAEKILSEQFELLKQRVEQEKPKSSQKFIEILVETTYTTTKNRKKIIHVLYSGMFLLDSFHKWEEVYRPYYEWIGEQLKEGSATMDPFSLARLVVGTVEQAAEMYAFYYQRSESETNSKRNACNFLEHALQIGESKHAN